MILAEVRDFCALPAICLPHSCRIVGKLVAAVQRPIPHTECILGAYATLWWWNFDSDAYAQIDLMMLTGPAANAILVIGFAKHEHEKGTSINVTKRPTSMWP